MLKESKKTKLPVIREGDRIRIINPIFVEKWGYEKDFKYYAKEIENKHFQAINSLIKEVFGDSLYTDRFWRSGSGGIRERVAKALAYEALHRNKHSGATRQLFHKEMPGLKDSTHTVMGKKVVWTGKYSAASGGYSSYDGEWDYEPANLMHPKSHILLKIWYGSLDGCLWVERENVELVESQ